MGNLSERVNGMLTKVAALKQTRDNSDELIKALEKDKTALPASAKAALASYDKKKKLSISDG